MAQEKTDNRYDIKGLRKAAGDVRQIINRRKRYSIYYSVIKHEVHIVQEGKNPDPDWLLVESDVCWCYDQHYILRILEKFLANFPQ